jgi:hypothetical protein
VRTGHWFITYTGTQFFLTDPHPDDVLVEDIAHALSMVCRFGGHTQVFYSVAQHSDLCRELVARWHPKNYTLQLHALLHDASEAYLGDIVRPLKVTMADYQRYEEQMMTVIYDSLGLSEPTAKDHGVIKKADNMLLMTERRDLINHRGIPWMITERPVRKHIRVMSSANAEAVFLASYRNLRLKVASTS